MWVAKTIADIVALDITLHMSQMERGETVEFQGYTADLNEDVVADFQKWVADWAKLRKRVDPKQFTFRLTNGRLFITCKRRPRD